MENWLAAAAAGVLALFGASTTGDHKPPKIFNIGSTTKKVRMDDRPASSTKPVLDVTCVASAVAARENSLATAETTFTSGINAAYAARVSALASAYTETGNEAIKTAVKAAWKQFASATQGTKRAWQKSRESAWQSFRTAIKSCGPSAASIADTGNAGSEMSGQ